MHQIDADDFIAKVMTGLWPDFKPADALRTLWYGILGPYEWGGAKTACENLKLSPKGRFREPKPTDFKEFAKLFRGKTEYTGPNANETDTFLQVVYSEKESRLGHYIPILPFNDDPDRMKRMAENTRRQMSGIYGDQYEIRTGCTDKQMIEERREMQMKLRAVGLNNINT